PDHAPALPVIAAKTSPLTDEALASRAPESGTTRLAARGAGDGDITEQNDPASGGNGLSARSVIESLSAKSAQDARNRRANRSLAGTKPDRSSIGGFLPDSAAGSNQASATAIAEAADRQRINWLHDYAMYILPAPVRQPRTYFQLTLSPTVNYRALSGGDWGPGKSVPNAPLAIWHPGDAQKYVDHSPALGFQVGGSLLYRVTRNLSIKGGLQFNFSRYKINAYSSTNPQQATITLSSYYGYVIDSLTSYTRIGNFGGRTQETFNNDYYQLSAPVGFELRVLGNERLQFNIGATIQPSYLLNTNSYMLTSNYTGYTKEPSLFRRWNVSGGLEAFLTYKLNGVRLQAGPEFRYQLLSTYTSQYPISENLKGYGFKLGIVKELP
ncbi:MAG: outer membrane beta-barrel protein, partial [Bacteroidetes bacterium]|nr:outer membrane beta-barrel protein [Bacteroidota bacterium]